MILNDTDDENDDINWIEKQHKYNISIYNCGCCDNCECDDNVVCNNCCCGCKIEDSSSEDLNENKYVINDFTIDIIEDIYKERKVHISLNLNINNKNIVISLDINRTLYLQIADDLFNK
jgi:hypothetical protein